MNIQFFNPVAPFDGSTSPTTGNTLIERAYNLERRYLAAQTWQEVLALHTPDSAQAIIRMGMESSWLAAKADPVPWYQVSSALVSFGDPFTGFFLTQGFPWQASLANLEASENFMVTGYRCNDTALLFDVTLERLDVAGIMGRTKPSKLSAALQTWPGGNPNPAGFTLSCADESITGGTRQVAAGGTLHLVSKLGTGCRARLSAHLANPDDYGKAPVWRGVLINGVDAGLSLGQTGVVWSSAPNGQECGSYEVAAAEGNDIRSVTIETHIPNPTDVPVTFDALFPDFAHECVSRLNAWHLTNIAMTGRDTTVNAHSENAVVYDSPEVKRNSFVTGVVPLGITAVYNRNPALDFIYGVKSQPVTLTGSVQSTVKLSIEAIGVNWSSSHSSATDGWVGSVSTQGTLDCSLSASNPIQIGSRGIARAKLLSDAKVSIAFAAALDPSTPKTVVFKLYVQNVKFPVAIYDYSRQFTYDDDALEGSREQLGFTGAITSFSLTIPDEKWQQLFGK